MSEDTLWYVKTPDGDVHRVTLDQLDEAFQAGRIDGSVMVLPSGGTQWQSLKDLAGLDDAAASTLGPTLPTMPNSVRPVSIDLSLDGIDENTFKKKSPKRLALGAIVGVLAVCAGVLVANRTHLGSSSAAPSAAAASPAPAAVAPAATPAPVDPTPAASATAPTGVPPLTDDQKQKLAAADKALESKAKSRKKNRAGSGSASGHGAKYKSQGFTNGGNKFDPLNSSL